MHFVGGATDRLGFGGELNIKQLVQFFNYSYGLVGDFGSDPVSGQDCDGRHGFGVGCKMFGLRCQYSFRGSAPE